jgi:hypothetical protein
MRLSSPKPSKIHQNPAIKAEEKIEPDKDHVKKLIHMINLKQKYLKNILQSSESYRKRTLATKMFYFFKDKTMIPHRNWQFFENIVVEKNISKQNNLSKKI